MYVPFRRAWRERDWHCIPAFLTHLMAFGVVVSSSNGRSVSDTNYTQVSYGSIYSRDECINGREYSLPSAFPFRPSSTVLPVMVVPSATKIEHSQFPHCSGVEIHKKKKRYRIPNGYRCMHKHIDADVRDGKEDAKMQRCWSVNGQVGSMLT